MKIYMIRHGETDWNVEGRLQGREDIPLNQRGILQAENCGQAFLEDKIKAIITSPLSRAKDTADIIAKLNNIEEVITDERLIERDFGKLSGMTYDKKKQYDTFGTEQSIEPWDELCNRFINAMKEYALKYNDADIIMVSHGGSINAVISYLTNGEMGTGKTRLKNTCINIITYKDERFTLEKFNLSREEYKNKRQT
ncbi:MAG TPA: histidine phosphatase family protein [Clostridiales bacterium]|nr:histidine phosphatase family protein [Clostridiales bacterium]